MDLGIVTSNISADLATPPGVPTWYERREAYIELIRSAEPDLISVQEVMPQQLHFLRRELPNHRVITVNYINGEGDDEPTSELCDVADQEIENPYEVALFYRADLFHVADSGHWWLSPTPDHPSVGFGNVWPRVVLWASLQTGPVTFTVFATHVDHRAVDPMIEMCRARFGEVGAKVSTQILAGDLNFNPLHAAYSTLISDGWRDSAQDASDDGPTFLYDEPQWPSGRLDHVFSRGPGVSPEAWCRLLPPSGRPPVSDHHPVYARLRLD